MSDSTRGALILISAGIALGVYVALHLQQVELVLQWVLGNQ